VHSILKQTEKRSGSQKTEGFIYTNESTILPELSEEVSRYVQQPDNEGLLSTLRYSYGLAKAVLSAWPSAQLAIIEQGATGSIPKGRRLRNWTIRGALSRRGLQSSTNDFPSFNLRAVTGMQGVRSHIGPSAAMTKGESMWSLTLDLRLRPKILPPAGPFSESADISTQPVEDLVSKLVEDLWRSLRGQQFTSFVSWNEAVVTHLQSSFGRSEFDQYLELEDVRVVSERILPHSHTLQWIHEPLSLTASLQGWHLGNDSLSQVLKLRQRSPETVENEAAPMSVSLQHPYESTS
jgi:hypothetical protein